MNEAVPPLRVIRGTDATAAADPDASNVQLASVPPVASRTAATDRATVRPCGRPVSVGDATARPALPMAP